MQLHKGKSVRKRSAGPSNTGNERRKVRRISAGEGMAALANSMETAFDLLKDIVSGASQCTPRSEALKIQAQAMEAIEKDEGFSDEDIKDAALVIADNPSTANTYLHIKNKHARKSYLLHMMEKLRNKD
jgi:ATP-dependent protease HslVU (ClpYQ) peptidase subunit